MHSKIFTDFNWLTEPQWKDLFSSYPEPQRVIQHLQSYAPKNVSIKNVAVYDDANTVLIVIPLFSMRYAIASLLDGALQKCVSNLAKILPSVFMPRILVLGFLEGEWGCIGIKSNLGQSTLLAAWNVASSAIQNIAKDIGAKIIVLPNFIPESIKNVSSDFCAQFSPLKTYPYSIMQIPYKSMEEYFASLSKATRKDMRRKLKSKSEITIERTTDINKHLDRAHELYLSTITRSDFTLEALPKEYFKNICSQIPGAYYVLYKVKDTLMAFNLLIVQGDFITDKYFAMDPSAVSWNLWFISWFENIEWCISNNIHTLYAGSGLEKVKQRLGAQIVPTTTLFYHQNKFIHAIVSRLTHLISYTPEVTTVETVSEET